MIELITDRTAQDVARVKELTFKDMTEEELTEWLAGMKGAYNYTDLNRVNEAVIYVTERLKTVGWYIEPITKTDWTMTDFPTASDMKIYLDNIRLIRSCLPTNIPQVPADMDKLSYEEANTIERILILIDDVITNIMDNIFYSNEIYAGEVIR